MDTLNYQDKITHECFGQFRYPPRVFLKTSCFDLLLIEFLMLSLTPYPSPKERGEESAIALAVQWQVNSTTMSVSLLTMGFFLQALFFPMFAMGFSLFTVG